MALFDGEGAISGHLIAFNDELDLVTLNPTSVASVEALKFRLVVRTQQSPTEREIWFVPVDHHSMESRQRRKCQGCNPHPEISRLTGLKDEHLSSP